MLDQLHFEQASTNCKNVFLFHYQNGIDGLVAGSFEPLTWESVRTWTTLGGAMLGTKRTLSDGKLPEIAQQVNLALGLFLGPV